MPSSLDFQSIIGMLSGIDVKMQTVFDDASRRSADAAEMHDRTRDVERQMVERESHFMSEIEARNAHQQEVMQAHQENLRAQVTQQREEIQSMLAAQQFQMERRLKDKFFWRIESIAEAIRPASGTLPAVTSIEAGVNDCMDGVNEALSALFRVL